MGRGHRNLRSMVTRQDILDIVEKYFDSNRWGDRLPITNGGISIEVKIENGNISMVVADKRREFVMNK